MQAFKKRNVNLERPWGKVRLIIPNVLLALVVNGLRPPPPPQSKENAFQSTVNMLEYLGRLILICIEIHLW